MTARPGAHLALFIPTLGGGGIGRSMLQLGAELSARGHRLDLLAGCVEGPYRDEIPAAAKHVHLERAGFAGGRLAALRADPGGLAQLLLPVLLAPTTALAVPLLPALSRYLGRARPDVLVTAHEYANLVGLWARRLSGVETRVVATLHQTMSRAIRRSRKPQWRFLAPLMRRAYPWADAVVAVSAGAAGDLEQLAGLPPDRIATIYNAVVGPDLTARAQSDPGHPWLRPGEPPVVLSAARFRPQKDFETLLCGFARVRRERELRLVLLGQGRGEPAIRSRARELGIEADLDLPGFAANPFAYMSRAALFVLSSRFEALPTVLIEALACGCPVVSTDCPHGPREILADGSFGRLVPVGDEAAMAEAIAATLDEPVDAERLRSRAAEFSVERAADRYEALFFGDQARGPSSTSR